MHRSLSYLRRGLLGIAFLGSLGFGATQAFGTPSRGPGAACTPRLYEYASATCGFGCPGNRGYCSTDGVCVCGLIP